MMLRSTLSKPLTTTHCRKQHILRAPAPRAVAGPQPSIPARPGGAAWKAELVEQLLDAKHASGKTFTQIAKETGLTNVYVAQLFYNQSQLKPDYVSKLQAAVPQLGTELLVEMQKAPSRRFDPLLIQEPSIYRLYEAIMHGGEGLKAIINEECGDGIMSAIDFYCSIDKMPGKHGEQRIVITMNGKYLPFVAQTVEDDVAHRSP